MNHGERTYVGGKVKHNYVNNLKMFRKEEVPKFSTEKDACVLKAFMIKSRSGGNNLRKHQWEGQ